MDKAEWTRIATRAVSRCACRAQVPNPFVVKCFGFPSSAWARQIYLLSERERSSQTRTARRGRRSERPTLPDDECGGMDMHRSAEWTCIAVPTIPDGTGGMDMQRSANDSR
jgi:hypothetical protein